MSALKHFRLQGLNSKWWQAANVLRNPAAKLVTWYVVASALWIWLSDKAVATLVREPHAVHTIQTYKGWFFVAVTGALLGMLVRRDLMRIEQSQAGLREREARLRVAAEAGNVGLWEWDFATGRVLWNDQLRQIAGWPPGNRALTVRDFEDMIHPEDRAATRLAYQNAVAPLADCATEFRIVRPDGSVRWIASRGRIECDDNGKPVRMIGAALDLTGRKESEQLRADALSYARTILETSPVGITTYRATGETVSVNEAVARIIGGSLEQIRGENFRRLDWWRQYGLLSTADRALATAQEQQLETVITNTVGKQLWVNLRFAPFHYGSEPQLLVIMTDVTAQKQAEETLRRTSETLQAIVNSSPAAIFDIGTDGRVRSMWNPGAERMFGWTRDEVIGRVLPIVPQNKIAEFAALRQRAVAGEFFSNLEVRRWKRDGTPIDLNLATAPLTDLTGRVTGIVTVATDITERKRAEVQLQQQADALRDLSARVLRLQDEERRRIARELHDTSAQHLAALALGLAVLQKTLPADDQRAQKLCKESQSLAEAAAQEIRTMSYLLHPPLLEAVGLAAAIRDYASGFTQRSGIRVDVEAPEESVRLSRDAELALFRICQEGLANIRRHSGSASATIRLAFEESWVRLELHDVGTGIPKEKLASITEMKAALGVGIAGMRERMRQLGGQVEIQSGRGGTMVRATLPVKQTMEITS